MNATAPIAQGEVLTARDRSRALRWVALSCVAVGMAVLWTWVLPEVARQSGVQRVIERNHANGVNANAMYYTELEGVRFLDLRD